MEDMNLADDLMPMEGGSSVFEYSVDEDMQREIAEEKAMVQAGRELVEYIMAAFDDELEIARSIDGIVLGQGVATDAQVLAKQQYQKFLEQGKQHIATLIDQHLEV